MSKELEALDNLWYGQKTTENYKIIETKLKENKKLKKLYKAELKNVSYYNNLALKYKKALEIIKNKKVNVRCIMSGWVLGKYNSYKAHIKLTEEEYNLLKEVLL